MTPAAGDPGVANPCSLGSGHRARGCDVYLQGCGAPFHELAGYLSAFFGEMAFHILCPLFFKLLCMIFECLHPGVAQTPPAPAASAPGAQLSVVGSALC